MKKRVLFIGFGLVMVVIILLVLVCWKKKDNDSYQLSIKAQILSNNEGRLWVKGFPQNPEGSRGEYVICEKPEMEIYDAANRRIEFAQLKEGDKVLIWYDWDIQGINTDFGSQIALKDNQEILEVLSISIVNE